MSDEVWGVFLADGPATQLLVAVFEDEDAAIEDARERAERAWEEEGSVIIDEKAELDLPLEVFEDQYSVEPVARDLVDFGLLSRGFAQTIYSEP
jgi:hypothetical protein